MPEPPLISSAFGAVPRDAALSPSHGSTSADRDRLLPLDRVEPDICPSGIPAPKARNWLANPAAEPKCTFHLKHGVVADLPATVTFIVDLAERRRILAVLVEELNRRNGPDSPWPEAVLEDWVEHSPPSMHTSGARYRWEDPTRAWPPRRRGCSRPRPAGPPGPEARSRPLPTEKGTRYGPAALEGELTTQSAPPDRDQ